MKTSSPKPPVPQWLLLDAEGESLGRIAARAATILRGKHRPTFSPHQVCGDHVLIVNVAHVHIPPAKFRRKVYFRHTGHVGHLRRKTLRAAFTENSCWVLAHAVKGMLPANRLRPRLLQRLHLFSGKEHEHSAQTPLPISLSHS